MDPGAGVARKYGLALRERRRGVTAKREAGLGTAPSEISSAFTALSPSLSTVIFNAEFRSAICARQDVTSVEQPEHIRSRMPFPKPSAFHSSEGRRVSCVDGYLGC